MIRKEDLPPGVYYLRVEYPGWNKVIPVIKARP